MTQCKRCGGELTTYYAHTKITSEYGDVVSDETHIFQACEPCSDAMTEMFQDGMREGKDMCEIMRELRDMSEGIE